MRITIDIAVALLLLSQVAQWVGIYLNNRNSKRMLEARMKEEANKAQIPLCAAAAEMVTEHIGTLARHTAEIAGVMSEVKTLRDEVRRGFNELNTRLDRVLGAAK